MSSRMLIVEDDPHASAIVRRAAEQCGLEVREAASGGEFAAALDEWSPDIYVIDIFLPDTDGFGLLEMLDARRQHGKPVFVMTGGNRLYLQSAENFCRAYGLNILAQIEKPLSISALRDEFDRLEQPPGFLVTGVEPNGETANYGVETLEEARAQAEELRARGSIGVHIVQIPATPLVRQ